MGSNSPAPAWARFAVLAAGAVLAIIMLVLGLWQMQVFEDRGDKVASERAAQAPVALVERIPRGAEVGDVYGRTVTVGGTYIPNQRVVVLDADGTRRLLAAMQLSDGRVLPVVLGNAPAGENPTLPDGWQSEEGIFMPSEAGETRSVPADAMSSVRLQTLAQRWPQDLTPGFLTLSPGDAKSLGLAPATVDLKGTSNAVRNLGYAVQWWVFAGFALAMSFVIAKSMRTKAVDPVELTD